jgi:hypothetical protein
VGFLQAISWLLPFVEARSYSIWKNIFFRPHEYSRAFPRVLHIKEDFQKYLVFPEYKIAGWDNTDGYPWPMVNFHFIKLPRHDISLPVRVATTDDNSKGTDRGGSPKPKDLPLIPPPLASLVGAILVVGSSKLLFNAMDGSGKLVCAAFLGGFPFFMLGVALLLFCFLPEPPPIFWFAVEPWWHWCAT